MWVGCGYVCVGYVGFYLFADFILCTQGTNTAFLWSLPMVTSRWVYMYVGWGVGVCVWGIWVSISMLIAYCALKVHTQHFWAVCLWWPQNEYICLWVCVWGFMGDCVCSWVGWWLWVGVCNSVYTDLNQLDLIIYIWMSGQTPMPLSLSIRRLGSQNLVLGQGWITFYADFEQDRVF